MEFKNPYWSNRMKITALQRWVLVHSIRYYEMDSPLVSDEMFDRNCKQLAQMQAMYKDDAFESRYWYAFDDFEGSTGFYLMSRLKAKDKKQLFAIAESLRDVDANTGLGKISPAKILDINKEGV